MSIGESHVEISIPCLPIPRSSHPTYLVEVEAVARRVGPESSRSLGFILPPDAVDGVGIGAGGEGRDSGVGNGEVAGPGIWVKPGAVAASAHDIRRTMPTKGKVGS